MLKALDIIHCLCPENERFALPDDILGICLQYAGLVGFSKRGRSAYFIVFS